MGVGPRGIVVADFDRDGRVDIAVANYFSHNVSILIADGAGRFTTGVGYVAGRGPESLAAGDFNLDGKIDLATLDTVWQKLVLLVGKGDGRFSTPATYAVGISPSSIATGDFNGDGKLDAAVANFSFNPSTVSLLLGDGRGGFRLTQSFDVGPDPRSLTAADFNGDGKLDLATVNRVNGTLSVLIGNGSGGFAAARTFSTGSDVISVAMRAGDFNGDGRVDLAVANTVSAGPTATVSILLGDGAGNFSPAQTVAFDYGAVATGDLDGDGLPEIVATGPGLLAVFRNGCGAGAQNPIDDTAFFVRQHYLDFLDREPDAAGLAFWTNEIESCGSNQQCRDVKRINVSAAFFLSIEFQQTGYLAYRAHKVAFRNIQDKPVPITREEMLADLRIIGKGVIVNAEGWEQKLEQNKQNYFDQLAASSRFAARYPQTLTPEQFVDALNSNAAGALSQSEREALVNDLRANAKTRAQVLRAVVEDADLNRAEFNKAFVLMQYFGYLRRSPDGLPDHDYSGWQFWLSKLNQFDGDFIKAEMVKAFINSDEYRNRFSQ